MRIIYLLISVLLISKIALASDAKLPLTEEALLTYATTPYDHVDKNVVSLGQLNGVPVIAEFICSDMCPEYTVRVIHYVLKKDQNCNAVGGIEKELLVPASIAVTNKTFCFPKVIVDNWNKYKRKLSYAPDNTN